MTDDKFFERLREDAAQLRYAPEDAATTRIAARVRGRLSASPSVAQMLAGWLRPVMASFVMLALVASLSITWVERRERSTASNDLVASNSLEITVDGDTYSVGQ